MIFQDNNQHEAIYRTPGMSIHPTHNRPNFFYNTPVLPNNDLQPRVVRGGIAARTTRRRKRTRRHRIHTNRRWRHPQRRILLKEIRRSQHNTDRLSRHDREILRAREMRQSKLQVADDIGVLDILIALRPVQHGLVVRVVFGARRLADVVAGGE